MTSSAPCTPSFDTESPRSRRRVPRESCPRPARRRGLGPRRQPGARTSASRRSEPEDECLACYRDSAGSVRELIARRGAAGSTLVLDRDAATRRDRRLVAHLGADEPRENATLVCDRYVSDAHRGRCRRVTACDLVGDPYANEATATTASAVRIRASELSDPRDTVIYRLDRVPGRSACALRWQAHFRCSECAEPRPVSLRQVVGALESYEPACELTLAALAHYGRDPRVAIGAIRGEHIRLRASPIVLNRRLREVVLAAIDLDGVSMSEIALRCGRVKRDSKGNASGETSWLARRIGLVPESGATRPTPWVHSDVLALIARAGLGVSPREVELE
jgi:hypothetical protein